MSEKMDMLDRQVLVAATLAAGCCDADTSGEEAVEMFQEVLFRLAARGGVSKIHGAARRTARDRLAHQAASPSRKAR
jgi:hypothetical protein